MDDLTAHPLYQVGLEQKQQVGDETVVVTARLPRELGNWVNKEFSRGFKQQFMHQCFDSLHHVLTTGEMPPESEYARKASAVAMQRMAS